MLLLKYFNILKTLFQTFGIHIKYLILPIYRFFYGCLTHFTLFLDRFLFPKYQQEPLEKPVFIIGHPRSGTTFLHRFMVKNCRELSGLRAWEMLFPAISARKLFRPIIENFKMISPQNIYDSNIHKTGFFEPETDDAAIFMRYFDGLLFWIYFEAWQNNTTDQLQQKLKAVSQQKRFLTYLKSVYQHTVFQQQSTYYQQRMLSKSFSFIINFEELRQVFPNGKFVFLLRDPIQSVPSSMSLVRSAQSNLHSFEQLDEQVKKQYYANLYQASLLFYQFLDNYLNKFSDNTQVSMLVVTHKALKNDFEQTMNRVIHFCELQKTDVLLQAIDKQLNKQTAYKSKHHYTLEEFGLSEKRIKRDFDFIYQKYNV